MLTRRAFLTGAIATATAVVTLANRAQVSAREWLLNAAMQDDEPRGTPYPLVALPTKAPLGQVYELPPNYETPMHKLIGEKNYPYTDNEYYYVRYREPMPPKFDWDEFRLNISGDAIENPREFSMKDLMEFEPVTVSAVGSCSGLGRGLIRPLVPGMPWTKGDFSCAKWTGASLKAVVESCGIKANAKMISLRSGASTIAPKKGDYIRSYLPEDILVDDSVLAWHQNGVALNFWNGYPLRVVVPGTTAPRWVKQIVEIEVSSTSNEHEWSGREIGAGKLKTYSLITNPADGTEVKAGDTVALKGVAWDAGQGIEKVEITADGGKSWQDAELEEQVDTYAWRVFNAEVKINGTGIRKFTSRATSADGSTQPWEPEQSVIDNGYRNNNASETFFLYLVGV